MKYGGIALIVLGTFLLIDNSKAFPMFLILLLIGILLIVFSKEKSIEVSYKKSLDEKICSRFGFKNTTEVKLLCDYISTATTQFNKSNNCNISNEKVIDFFFTKFKDDVPFFTINDIQNKHFGFLYYSYMCCFMFFDKKYAEMKEQFASDVEIFVPNQEREKINKEFYQIMDEAYVDKSFEYLSDSLENANSIEDLPEEGLPGIDIIDETILRFKQKYNLTDDSFLKEKIKNEQ